MNKSGEIKYGIWEEGKKEKWIEEDEWLRQEKILTDHYAEEFKNAVIS